MEDAVAARSIFDDDLFVDFPFQTDGDKAGAFAAMLLPFVRNMIKGPSVAHHKMRGGHF